MNCPRCQGLMIEDLREVSSRDCVSGWRCLLCGETTDSGSEANRMSHGQPSRNRARVPGSPTARSWKAEVCCQRPEKVESSQALPLMVMTKRDEVETVEGSMPRMLKAQEQEILLWAVKGAFSDVKT